MDPPVNPNQRRKERYSRQTRKIALAQMRRLALPGRLGASEVARLIGPQCSPSTPRRWMLAERNARDGREMMARMVRNVAAGRPIDEPGRFARVRRFVNAENAPPARMGED